MYEYPLFFEIILKPGFYFLLTFSRFSQCIFVYAMTDRNVITLEQTSDNEQQEEGEMNLRDAMPFYSRYGFMVDHKFQRANAEYIQEGTVPMVASKIRLQNSLRLVENKDVKRIKYFILICTHFTK